MHLLAGGSGLSVAVGTGEGDSAGVEVGFGLTWALAEADKRTSVPSINKTVDITVASTFLSLFFVIQISTLK